MNRWSLSDRADEDLLDIYVYGVKQFGRQQALSYIHDIEDIFDLLVNNPRMGRRADAISAGARRHEHGRHVIIYEETPSGISVLTVVHASAMKRLRL